MGKEENIDSVPPPTWDELLERVSPVAKPLASRKLCKRVNKLLSKASKRKQVTKGLKFVQKSLRKGQTGLVVLAGDVSPMDITIHLPAVCEDKNVPYCYIPSQQMLGESTGGHHSICVAMINSHEDYEELYTEVNKAVENLPLPI